MKLIRRNPILGLVNEYLVDSPSPMNISYFWSFGSLLGLNLVVMIITGLTLAMHYTASTAMAFNSVEHIMRDVNNGWLLRYIHANGASFFFIFVYIHIGRGLYYGSYRSPRGLLWTIGVIIYLLMMATGFIGYVLPGGLNLAQYENHFLSSISLSIFYPFGASRTLSKKRIGPHNIDVISVLVGNLLGDAHGEIRAGSPRFSIHMYQKNREYLGWLHKFYAERGYTSFNEIIYKKQIGKNGTIYYSGKLNMYTFSSLKWLYNLFYRDRVKRINPSISDYMNPLTLAIWFMDDGGKYKKGVIFSTYCFPYEDQLILQNIILQKFGIPTQILKKPAGHILYIHGDHINEFIKLVKPYVVPSMLYKIEHGNQGDR